MTSRSLFLSLDGLDGTGKSTQCRLLVEWLREQGRDTSPASIPADTDLGGELRQILLSHASAIAPACEALLFMASRAQLVAEVIRPALDSGKVVVSDRFLLANVVYQGHAGSLDVDLLWQVGQLATGGLRAGQDIRSRRAAGGQPGPPRAGRPTGWKVGRWRTRSASGRGFWRRPGDSRSEFR